MELGNKKVILWHPTPSSPPPIITFTYYPTYRMEEDEEIIKKLMNMLGSGRELKFKSPNGQTIRVSFEGNSYN